MAEKNSLWKNIRKKAEQNKRTGNKPKEPTREMLRQERKIKANQKADGGYMYDGGGKIYANKQGVIMGPVQNPDGSYTVPVSNEGLPQVNLPEFEVVSTPTGYAPGQVIEERRDFEPWWNWASKKAGDVERRQDAYGNLGDLYAYYGGQPLKHNVLERSKYKPTNAKNPNATYISINDPKFKQEVFEKYKKVFLENQLQKDWTGEVPETKINDNTYAVSGYTRPTIKDFKEAEKLGISPIYIKGKDHVSNAIGRYFLSKGEDEKGEYISYYDVFDQGTGSGSGGGIGETLGLTKPFEIYDRIYLDSKTGKPIQKAQGGTIDPPDGGRGKRPPIYTSNPNDPRLQMYNDSLDLYKQSNIRFKNFYSGYPKSTEAVRDSLQNIIDSKPHFEFDETSYKKDAKKGFKNIKKWEEYIYDGNRFSTYERSEKDKATQERIYNNEVAPHFKENDFITLKNGVERKYDDAYDGVTDKGNYTDFYPDGTVRGYYEGKLIYLSSDKIKPIRTDYYSKGKIEKGNSINTSTLRTERINDNPIVIKEKSNKNYQNWFNPSESFDIYKKPEQPVIYKKDSNSKSFTNPVKKSSIDRLQFKQYTNSNQQPGLVGNIENIQPSEINMDKFYEGQYEKYRRSPYEDPMYRVWVPGQQMQIVPESEFKKLNDQYALKDLEQKAYGGPMQYEVGGKVIKNIGAGAYGILSGAIGAVTGGATNKFMDKGYNYLQKKASKNFDPNDPDDVKWAKSQDQFSGYGTAVGGIGAGILTGNVQGAIGQTATGLNKAFQASDWASDDFKKWSNIGSTAIGIGAGLAGGNLNSAQSASKIGQAATKFGSQASKISPYANQALELFGSNEQTLLQQGVARQDYLNSPEYLAMKEQQNQAYVNQGLSFAANGGPVNNNLLTLQTDSMRKNINSYRRKYKEGGQVDVNDKLAQFGLRKIQNGGRHWQNPKDGVIVGNASVEEDEVLKFAEGGSANLSNAEYVYPDTVNDEFTLPMYKPNESLTDFELDKDGNPIPLDMTPAEFLIQEGTKGSPFRKINTLAKIRMNNAEAITRKARDLGMAINEQNQQNQQMMVGGALQYAAAGGKLNKDLERILSDDIQSYVEADNYYAYGGYLPKDKGFNMPNSYAKGGSIHIKKSKRGTFTAEAKKRGKSVQEFARDVLRNKGNYSSAMVKKANFARNAASWKHAVGGPLYGNTDSEYTYAHGGPVVSNVNQGFGLYAQNRGGMMMAQGGMMQQQGGQDQMIQLIQAYAQATGVSPEEIIQQLQQMEPQAQQQAIQQMAQELQGGQQQGMARGGNMYAVGGPPDEDPNSLDYITGVSDFMYSPEFLNYWTNTQDKRSRNFWKHFDSEIHRPLSEKRFSPTEGISDFDRTLGNLYSAEKAIFLKTNPDGSVCYMVNGQKVCGPPGQIQAMLANRDRTYQAQAVADVYQNTTGDLAPYNYNNITGSSVARPVNQPDYSGDQNFTDRQNTVRGMVSNAMTRNQPTPVQPIGGMQSRNLQQLPTNNTTPELIPNNYPESSYRPATLTEEEQNMLNRMSNTSGFIPSDITANRMGTPTVEGPLNTSIPRETSTRQNITEQNIRFTPPEGSDMIEDLPGFTPNQTKVFDEAIGLNQPNSPKLTFTQSDATKYGLNSNDVNIISDPKVNQPNQGLTGLDYASMIGQAAAGFHQLGLGLKGGDPVNYERVTGEKIDPTVAIALAAEEGRRAQDSAAYLMRQSAPTSGSYMNNLRNLSLQSGKQRGALAGGLRYQADLSNTQMQNELNKVNAGISMQEQIARQQEQDAARTNITEGLSGIGSSTANMIRDYRINQLNQTIANNIGTNNFKFDPVNETLTYRNPQTGKMVTVPAQTVVGTNPVNIATGQMQQPKASYQSSTTTPKSNAPVVPYSGPMANYLNKNKVSDFNKPASANLTEFRNFMYDSDQNAPDTDTYTQLPDKTDVETTKAFQDWMDEFYPNWLDSGKSLNKGKGYGNFGDQTQNAWYEYGKEFLGRVPNMYRANPYKSVPGFEHPFSPYNLPI